MAGGGAGQPQHRPIAADELGRRAEVQGQVDELLVVGVGATAGRASSRRRSVEQGHHAAHRGEHRLDGYRPARKRFASEHMLQLFPHGRGADPTHRAGADGGVQLLAAGVAEEQPIEHDVGIENHAGHAATSAGCRAIGRHRARKAAPEVGGRVPGPLAGIAGAEYTRGLFSSFCCALCRAARRTGFVAQPTGAQRHRASLPWCARHSEKNSDRSVMASGPSRASPGGTALSRRPASE